MKLKITTVYEGLDEKWFQWWMKGAAKNYGMIGEGKEALPHEMVSRDPTSNVLGTTRIELIEDKETV